MGGDNDTFSLVSLPSCALELNHLCHIILPATSPALHAVVVVPVILLPLTATSTGLPTSTLPPVPSSQSPSLQAPSAQPATDGQLASFGRVLAAREQQSGRTRLQQQQVRPRTARRSNDTLD